MSRNANSRFAVNPTSIDISRSTFDRDFDHKTTFNTGELIPFYWDEVLPGDTHQIRTSKVVRMQSLITPMYDNMYIDVYYFFVPARLTWQHWNEFMGENSSSAWIPQTEYVMPQLVSPEGGFDVNTIADYMGIPTGVDNLSVSALPIRAYALICNEWFRDQNLMDPLNIPLDDSTVTGVNTDTYVTDVVKGGKPFKVAKYHDYFTSALPGPQKGNPVTIPVATAEAPVFGNGYNLGLTNSAYIGGLFSYEVDDNPFINYGADAYGVLSPAASGGSGESTILPKPYGIGVVSKAQVGDHPEYSGLYASLGDVSVVDINSLRIAFQMQKFLEKDARGGTRYREIIKSHFGVTSPDARMQVPEYLGGNRVPVMINQVVQQSGTIEGSTPQGNVTGYSLTSDSHGDFIKSFTEHGYIIGLMCVRYDHTYQQGVERAWSRKTREDFYFPVFANLGEQAILNKEIYATGGEADDEVFGYQERWAEYRYKPSRVSGEMRSNYSASLDSWHLGDYYTSQPYLSADWIREDSNVVDRVLAVDSTVSAQFFADIYVQNKTTRPMPMYSVPGLIDHH